MSDRRALGLRNLGRVEPGKQPERAPPMPPGVWCLHTNSTVPFVSFEGGEEGRVVTWGEAFELQESVAIRNASYHAGSIWLAPATGGVAAPRPHSIVVPVSAAVSLSNPLVRITSPVDVRRVVRAYLVQPASTFAAATVLNVRQFANRSDAGAPGGGELGPIDYTITLAAPAANVSLAFGSLQEPSQELRALAFWDYLQVSAASELFVSRSTFIVLHYQ